MKKASVIILKIISTAAALFASYYALIIIGMFFLERHKSHYSIHRFNCCTVTFAAFDMAEKEKDVFNNLVYLRRCVRNCARNKLRNNQV